MLNGQGEASSSFTLHLGDACRDIGAEPNGWPWPANGTWLQWTAVTRLTGGAQQAAAQSVDEEAGRGLFCSARGSGQAGRPGDLGTRCDVMGGWQAAGRRPDMGANTCIEVHGWTGREQASSNDPGVGIDSSAMHARSLPPPHTQAPTHHHICSLRFDAPDRRCLSGRRPGRAGGPAVNGQYPPSARGARQGHDDGTTRHLRPLCPPRQRRRGSAGPSRPPSPRPSRRCRASKGRDWRAPPPPPPFPFLHGPQPPLSPFLHGAQLFLPPPPPCHGRMGP